MEKDRADEALMADYIRGDYESFMILYQRYSTRVYGLLSVRLAGFQKRDADDLLQVTWLKVHEARKRFDPNKKFFPWLTTIALNTLRDYQREKRHSTEIASEHADLVSASPTPNAETKAILKEEILKLGVFMDRLPSSQKEVLLLSDAEGFQTEEISEILGLSTGAVRQLLFRARSNLQSLAKGERA
jgi:RNA polymerase sigma-70 factor (ECF subfamily)